MPGRLVMDEKDPVGPGGLKRDGSHLSQPFDGPDQKRVAIAIDGAAVKTNGLGPAAAVNVPTTNGVHAKKAIPAVTVAMVGATPQTDEPPEIEQFRDTLIPFGKILERMAQQTYFDLTEVVEALADMRVQQQPQMANGVGSQTLPDKSAVSVDKKLRVLNFAQTHKDRFIKALVLSDWARNMDDMAKLIDVSMFLRKQDWATAAAADGIYRLKENMMGAKMPNPNIEGALELLSRGQAPWMPDMGYITSKPLSADELLDTLTDMNFALSVRLNSHEELPKQFTNFTIANGRVTFTVSDEFEVDLAIADQEPDSPFYFIDLRLIFTPTISLNQDRLRNQLEAQINAALVSSGLGGCYDFLHNFVLSHKLNILRVQALTLARGKWSDHIEVQSIHRAVIIQYWKELPGGKNWLELGISSPKAGGVEDGDPKLQTSSRLSCRWFRRGQEILDHDLEFDFSNLSVEKMMDHVVATHASGRLTVISDGLGQLSSGTTSFAQTLETSTLDATDCVLSVHLNPHSVSLEIRVDPVRGMFCASPGSGHTADLERRINSENHVDVPLAIRNTLCRSVRRHITEQAESVGLISARADVRAKGPSPFPAEPVIYTSFRFPAAAQSTSEQVPEPRFVLTATVDLQNGLSWFLSQTTVSKSTHHIDTVHRLTLPVSSGPVDRKSILAIEASAVQMASHLTIAHELTKRNVLFKTSHKSILQVPGEGDSSLCVRVADVISSSKPHMFVSGLPSIFAETGLLSNGRLNGSVVEYTFRASLQKSGSRNFITHLRRGLKDVVNISVDSEGDLLMILQTSLGGSILPVLRERLQGVARVYAFIRVIGDNHFGVVGATLDEICFAYGANLTCTINICGSRTGPMLHFATIGEGQPDANPHHRIRRQLENMFTEVSVVTTATDTEVTKFTAFCAVLRATLPIVVFMSKAEDSEPPCTTVVTCHSATAFKLAFREPLCSVAFHILAKHKAGKLYWCIKMCDVKRFTDQGKQSIGRLWRDQGAGWQGLRTAAVADASGIEELLERIATVMRQCEVAAAGDAKTGKTANDAVVLD